MSQLVLYGEQLRPPELICWAISGAMVACFVLCLAIAAVDERTFDGADSVWAKPLKFELSLAIHAATLALAMSALSESFRSSTVMTVLAVVFLAASVTEMVYIIGQAARAEHSHFNVSTPFTRIMWSLMAMAAIVIVGTAGAIGVAIMFGSDDSLGQALKWAIVLGLIGGTLLTMYTAFTIGARMSPYIGAVPGTSSERMMLTGWSMLAGDLRVSHFLATHMIQVLPLLGLVVSQVLPGRIGVMIVIVAAIIWSAFTLSEYRRALAGAPSPLAVSFIPR